MRKVFKSNAHTDLVQNYDSPTITRLSVGIVNLNLVISFSSNGKAKKDEKNCSLSESNL